MPAAVPTYGHRHNRETILFAVVGMSPAVLTETVWALAHEKPALIPDRVVALTTARGADKIRQELLAPSKPFGNQAVWDLLRAATLPLRRADALRFGDTADHLAVFTRFDPATGRPRELEDIRTPEDNLAIADFILERLRGFTENPETRLIASIAGGRKTMGALLYACLSLLGRQTDRICHVLVNEPFDDPRLAPRFYFPGQPGPALSRPDGRGRLAPRQARIELANLPFVPLRNRFQDLADLPGNFNRLVARYSRDLKRDAARPVDLSLDEKSHAVTVDRVEVKLTARSFLVLEFLLAIHRDQRIPSRQKDAAHAFKAFLLAKGPQHDVAASFAEDPDGLKRELSSLRHRLQSAGLSWHPGLRAHSLRLPPYRLR